MPVNFRLRATAVTRVGGVAPSLPAGPFSGGRMSDEPTQEQWQALAPFEARVEGLESAPSDGPTWALAEELAKELRAFIASINAFTVPMTYFENKVRDLLARVEPIDLTPQFSDEFARLAELQGIFDGTPTRSLRRIAACGGVRNAHRWTASRPAKQSPHRCARSQQA